MPTHSTDSTDSTRLPGDGLRAFLRPSGVPSMPRIVSPAISPCEATQTHRMAYGVAYGINRFDGLRAFLWRFDWSVHVLGRIDQSNGLTGHPGRHSSDRPPSTTKRSPDARRP